MKLNRAQELAVKASGKNILVSAGAGTGKTRVLVERFLHFVLNEKVLVTEILALTFTDKAAAEMKSRIFKRFKDLGRFEERRQLESAAISTLHAFAARLLREHPLEAGVAPDFRVIEAEESDFMQEQALEQIFEEHCRKGTGIFEFMRVYGEPAVRAGIFAVYREARHAGQRVCEFAHAEFPSPLWGEGQDEGKANAIAPSPRPSPGGRGSDSHAEFIPQSPVPLLNEIEELELAREWQRFEVFENWDWQAVEDYKAWLKGLTKRKSPWPEIKTRAKQFLAWKLEALTTPWKESLLALAAAFETRYETAKQEEGLLDFDDLEIRATGLFKQKTEASERIRKVYRKQYRHILVDEFQDTSPLQYELIQFLAGGDNLFFVGDYKQSIYAFRGAEPALFQATQKAYEQSENGVCIPLIENYRSVPDVLNWINRFFENLWREDIFNFETLEASVPGPKPGEIGLIAVTARKGEEKSHARLREAEAIAAKIHGLHDEGRAYGEIAILFEAMTDAPLYEYALKKSGIPYFSVSSRGFYQQPEIRDMMSLLSFLENPFADIPLAAALRSPLFQVTDDTLYWLARHAKSADAEQPLYRGILESESIPEITGEEKAKLAFFRQTAAELMREKDKLRLTELFDWVLDRTGYELTLAAGADSVRRLANLKKLAAMARREETHGPLAAGDFLQRVKQLELQEVRESEAQIESEESKAVVRLMTIHKSKGLEFPVVFIADMGRSSRNSSTAKIMARASEGFGLQVFNEIARKWEDPWGWQRLRERQTQKEKEERKRLLYVAMTRAEEKLFLCGVMDEEREPEEKSFYELASWMDWLAASEPVLGEIPAVPEVGPAKTAVDAGILSDWTEIWQRVKGKQTEKKVPKAKEPQGSEILSFAQNDTKEVPAVEELAIRERLKSRPRVPSRAVDLPVSAFALFNVAPEAYGRVYEAGLPEAWEESPERQTLAQDVPADAADFGTAMHALFERLDFKNPRARLEELLTDSFAGLPPGCRPEAEKLLGLFMQTELFNRLARARRIERELPFVLRERHGTVQGVIDVLFEDEQGWHILDYKTAEGDEAKVRARGYEHQIAIYALACRRLLGKAPQSGILYFLKNQWQYVAGFDTASLNRAEFELRKAQEDILDYKNRLYNLS